MLQFENMNAEDGLSSHKRAGCSDAIFSNGEASEEMIAYNSKNEAIAPICKGSMESCDCEIESERPVQKPSKRSSLPRRGRNSLKAEAIPVEKGTVSRGRRASQTPGMNPELVDLNTSPRRQSRTIRSKSIKDRRPSRSRILEEDATKKPLSQRSMISMPCKLPRAARSRSDTFLLQNSSVLVDGNNEDHSQELDKVLKGQRHKRNSFISPISDIIRQFGRDRAYRDPPYETDRKPLSSRSQMSATTSRVQERPSYDEQRRSSLVPAYGKHGLPSEQTSPREEVPSSIRTVFPAPLEDDKRDPHQGKHQSSSPGSQKRRSRQSSTGLSELSRIANRVDRPSSSTDLRMRPSSFSGNIKPLPDSSDYNRSSFSARTLKKTPSEARIKDALNAFPKKSRSTSTGNLSQRRPSQTNHDNLRASSDHIRRPSSSSKSIRRSSVMSDARPQRRHGNTGRDEMVREESKHWQRLSKKNDLSHDKSRRPSSSRSLGGRQLSAGSDKGASFQNPRRPSSSRSLGGRQLSAGSDKGASFQNPRRPSSSRSMDTRQSHMRTSMIGLDTRRSHVRPSMIGTSKSEKKSIRGFIQSILAFNGVP